MRSGESLNKRSIKATGMMFFCCLVVFSFMTLARAEERSPVSMNKVLNIPNTTGIYDSLSIKIKASAPFKISLEVYTTSGDYCWLTYSSGNAQLSYDEMEGMISRGIGSNLADGKWHTIERNIQCDLEEAVTLSFSRDLRYINKIEILGSNFGVRSINVFYEKEVNGWLNRYPQSVSNFALPGLESMNDIINEFHWELSDPDYFSLEYDSDLQGYLQALGPLPDEDDSYTPPNAPDPTIYSPTDRGSYYSPYSVTGGYYDNFYSPWSYGYGGYGYGGYGGGYGYGGYGLGYGFGSGIFPGYGLGLSGLGGYGYSMPMYGLGSAAYGLPYSSYGYPYSLYGGALFSPLGLGLDAGLSGLTGGLGLSPLLTGLGYSPLLGTSGLLDSLQGLPTTSISIPTLVPSTNNLSLSSILGLSGLGISGLSDITIPVSTYGIGSTTINIPDLSSLLSLN